MRFARFFLALCPAVLAASPSLAEEGIKAGMPQLDMKFFPGQIFWLVVAFTILYILMARFALPGVARVQNKRKAIISEELAAATAANEAAKTIIAEYEQMLTEARSKAVAAEDTSKITQMAMEQTAAQQKVLNKSMQEAEARIAKARDAAMKETQKSSVEIANSVIEKITGMKLQVKS